MEGFPPHVFPATRHSRPRGKGIQVCFPPQLAWIPAFAGMTDRCGYFGIFRLSVLQINQARYFRRRTKGPSLDEKDENS
jgi:hypothetical protein